MPFGGMRITDGPNGRSSNPLAPNDFNQQTVKRYAPPPQKPNYFLPTYNTPYSPPPQAPAYQPQPAIQQQAPATPSFGIGTPDSGGMGGAPSPAPQSAPVISPDQWLAGDSTYQDQMGEYNGALKDFLARLGTQKAEFTSDYNTATQGMNRNRDQGMLNQGEDFTSRGLANSGLFSHAQDETAANFQRQSDGMKQAHDRTFSDFTNQEADKRKQIGSEINNAKSASLGRMSMKQMFN